MHTLYISFITRFPLMTAVYKILYEGVPAQDLIKMI